MEGQEQKFFQKMWNWIYGFIFPQQINKKMATVAFLVAFLISLFLVLVFSSTYNFPVGSVMEIKSGESLQSITVKLKQDNIIRSEFIFRSLVIAFGGEKKVIAGDYLLTRKEGTFSLARRLVNGKFGIDTVKITIPEGWNIFQIGDYLEKNLVLFNKKEFLELAKSKEGYLFPDTYFVSGSMRPTEVIKMLQDNYIKKITLLEKEILASGHTEKEIITMASILEGEALPKDRNVVAGILWKRLEIGMPLQVDATFSYINGKNTYELTSDDLKIDSLYNTYKYKGLPPGPINNPGLEAIKSALNPIKTKYLYFLTEKDGTIHYAKTFEEHKKNKERYL